MENPKKITEWSVDNGRSEAFACASPGRYQAGLTKREYFAGLAMQAVISNGKYSEIEIAICAVNFADDLLEELERTRMKNKN